MPFHGRIRRFIFGAALLLMKSPLENETAPASVGIFGSRRKVTQRDVAKACGLHNSTVSLSLRGCASISPDTRRLVRRIARSLGYKQDATSRALASYREKEPVGDRRETLAFVTARSADQKGSDRFDIGESAIGASAFAAASGFKLVQIELAGAGAAPRFFKKVLVASEFAGVIFADHFERSQELPDCAGVPLVRITGSDSGIDTVPHSVGIDFERNLGVALRKLLSMEFRRFGVIATHGNFELLKFSDLIHVNSAGTRIRPQFAPVLRLEVDSSAGAILKGRHPLACIETLKAWWEAWRPEAVISDSDIVYSAMQKVAPHVSFVSLDRRSSSSGIAGVAENGRALGANAVRTIDLLLRNCLRCPGDRSRTLVSGEWSAGASLKPALFA